MQAICRQFLTQRVIYSSVKHKIFIEQIGYIPYSNQEENRKYGALAYTRIAKMLPKKISPEIITATLFVILVIAAQVGYFYLVSQLLRTFFT